MPSVSYNCLVETVTHPKTGKIDNECNLPFEASTFSVLVELAQQFSVQQCLQYCLYQEKWSIFWPKVIVIKVNRHILAIKWLSFLGFSNNYSIFTKSYCLRDTR